MPRSPSTPVGPLVAYAAVSGPAWGIGLAVALTVPMFFAYSGAAVFFLVPGIAIGGALGALLSPIVTFASAVVLARRPLLGLRGYRWLAAATGALVVLPITIPAVAFAASRHWMPIPIDAFPPAVVVAVSLVSAALAAQSATFVRTASDSWAPQPWSTRLGWWLLAPGLAAALPLIVFCLAVSVLADDWSWDAPCVVAGRPLLESTVSYLPSQMTCVYADGTVELGERAVLIALAVVVATASAALLLCGLAVLAIGRTAVWPRGQVVIGFAVAAATVMTPLAVCLWIAAYVSGLAPVP
jgi:hypothetical protein